MQARYEITEHARARFLERWNKNISIEEAIENSFIQGSGLSKSLKRTAFYIGFNVKGWWTATYRLYQDTVFVFQKRYHDNQVTMILITVFPLHFLKQRRANFFKNRHRKAG